MSLSRRMSQVHSGWGEGWNINEMCSGGFYGRDERLAAQKYLPTVGQQTELFGEARAGPWPQLQRFDR